MMVTSEWTHFLKVWTACFLIYLGWFTLDILAPGIYLHLCFLCPVHSWQQKTYLAPWQHHSRLPRKHNFTCWRVEHSHCHTHLTLLFLCPPVLERDVPALHESKGRSSPLNWMKWSLRWTQHLCSIMKSTPNTASSVMSATMTCCKTSWCPICMATSHCPSVVIGVLLARNTGGQGSTFPFLFFGSFWNTWYDNKVYAETVSIMRWKLTSPTKAFK